MLLFIKKKKKNKKAFSLPVKMYKATYNFFVEYYLSTEMDIVIMLFVVVTTQLILTEILQIVLVNYYQATNFIFYNGIFLLGYTVF